MKKKRNSSKMGILLASTCLISALLTGCGNEPANPSSNNSSNGGQGTQTEGGNSDNGTAASGNQEKATLTVWAYWTNSDLYSDQGDWEYWQAIEEACNVDLQFLDSSGGKDALSLLAGTDDLPDIIIDYDSTFPGGGSENAIGWFYNSAE